MQKRILPLIIGVLLALAACSSSASTASEPNPTASTSSPATSTSPVVAPTTTTEPDSLALTDTTVLSTTPADDPMGECVASRYTMTIPDDWFSEDCTIFSPFEIPPTGEREYRPEIDLFFTTSERYGEAFDRVNAELDVVSYTTFYIDGQIASVFTLSEEWYAVGERTVYVVDAGDGVLFASANELIDTEPVTDLHAHYETSVEALHEMMASSSIEFVNPAA